MMITDRNYIWNLYTVTNNAHMNADVWEVRESGVNSHLSKFRAK
jgi:hypothetical protein